MSKKAYSQEERIEIREKLLTTGRQRFARQGYRHTTLAQIYEEVGISKNFFYSFFPSKEDFVAETMKSQQPLLVDMSKKCMAQPGATWKDGVRHFLELCIAGAQTGIIVMSIEDQNSVFRNLSAENFENFHRLQVRFYQSLAAAWGLQMDAETAKLFGNMALSILIVNRSMEESLPAFFQEVREETAREQIEGLIARMECHFEKQ
ncbi:TetR/AcrR family transcriptional regulator [Emergencia sp.]|uniref:TetR/AcrR family transcriptional regulator n=1 Tax=Emergencia sp. TaxID=1926557 RepID=UPI003AEF51CE